VVNVGAGGRTSLLGLIEIIEKVTGRRLAYRRLPAREGEVRDSVASLERAERLLGYRPHVSLTDGLARTWAWFARRPVPPASRRTPPAGVPAGVGVR
jgi:nucleoside-diphosphate-sugar epimerase